MKTLLLTFFMAMVPVVELRGAIPFGVAAGLHPLAAMGAAILGNLFPVPFILLLLRHVFRWLRHFPRLSTLIDQLERRAHLKGRKVRKYRTLGLVLLVAVPLPGTGAWTGALVADVLDADSPAGCYLGRSHRRRDGNRYDLRRGRNDRIASVKMRSFLARGVLRSQAAPSFAPICFSAVRTHFEDTVFLPGGV